MKLDDLKKEAAADTLKPDEPNLDEASTNIPRLHKKWLDILSNEKLALVQLNKDLKKLEFAKWQYYSGKMDPDEIKKRGWDPFNHRVLKSDMDKYMSADEDIREIRDQIELQYIKIDYAESVYKEISQQRQWNIKNAITWRQFITGAS